MFLLTPILSWLGSLLGGPFAKAAVDAYKAKLANENNADQRAADLLAKEMALQQREDELNAQIVIAEQGRWWTALIRPLFALPVIIYLWKIIVYDVVLGAWTYARTDPLSPNIWTACTVILTGYFVGRSIEKAVATLKK